MIGRRKKSKSPPHYSTVPGFNPIEDDIIRRPPAPPASLAKGKETQFSPTSSLVKLGGDRNKKNKSKEAVQKAPQVSTVEEEEEEEDQSMEEQKESDETEEVSVTNAATSRVAPYPRIATNDGTHRLTIQ